MREINIYKRLLKGGMGLLLIFLISGCGDNIFSGNNSSLEAKIEEAKIALDEGVYDSAIKILEGICGTDINNPQCDSDMISLLASAYMGTAGLDVISLIDAADKITTNNPNDNTAAFDMFADIIKPSNIDNLQTAITLLNNIDDAERTTEQELQRAVASASHMVANIIATVAPDFNPENPQATVYQPEKVNSALVETVINDLAVAVDSASEVTATVTGGDIDLTSEIEGFTQDIDKNGDGIKIDELKNYVTALNN